MLWGRTPVRAKPCGHAGRQTSRTLASASNGHSGDPWKSFLDWFMESSTAPHHRHQPRRRCASTGKQFQGKGTGQWTLRPLEHPSLRAAIPEPSAKFTGTPRINGQIPTTESDVADSGARRLRGNISSRRFPINSSLTHYKEVLNRLHVHHHRRGHPNQPAQGRAIHFTSAMKSSSDPIEQLESALEQGVDAERILLSDQPDDGISGEPIQNECNPPATVAELLRLLSELELQIKEDDGSITYDAHYLTSRVWKAFKNLAESIPHELKALRNHDFTVLFEIAKRSRVPCEERVNRVMLVMNTLQECGRPASLRGFEALMSAHIGEAGASDICTKILQGAIENGITPRIETYNILLRARIVEHGVDPARTWLAEHVEGIAEVRSAKESESFPFAATVSTFNAIIHGHIQAGDIRRALQCVKEMEEKGLRPNFITWTMLIFGYSKCGDRSSVIKTFHDMIATNVRPSRVTYETVIFALLGGGRVKRDFLQQDSRERTTYPVSGDQKAGNDEKSAIEEAMEVYEDMITAGFKPGVMLYNIFMTAYLNRKELPRVKQLFDEMVNGGLYPDVATYTIAISACSAANDISAVDEVFGHLRQSEIEPDIILYGTVMSVHAQKGNLVKVRTYVEDMVNAGWKLNYYIWHILLHAYCQSRDMTGAHKIVEEMQRSGFPATEITYNTLINGYGHVGNVVAAEEVFRSFVSKKIKISVETFNIMINALARNQDREGAMRIYAEMIDRGLQPDRITFNILIKLESNRLDAIGASNRYREMLSAGLEPDERTYIPMINLHARRSDFDRARSIQRHLLSLDHLTPTFQSHNAFIEAYWKQGSVLDAVKEYEFATEVKQMTPDIRTFDMLVRAFGYKGDVESARQWFDKCIDVGIRPDTRLWNALMSGYVTIGDRDGAFAVWKEMEKAGAKADIFTYTLMLKAGVNQSEGQQKEQGQDDRHTATSGHSQEGRTRTRERVTKPTERRHSRLRAWINVGLDEKTHPVEKNVSNVDEQQDGQTHPDTLRPEDSTSDPGVRVTSDTRKEHESAIVSDHELLDLATEEIEDSGAGTRSVNDIENTGRDLSAKVQQAAG
ncbi:hypothetical protein SpCBS45565_g01790 [Spizellomyces sp. 'palustris']|nr:hypothetical protein SpCBS45565_g01790 [Spizellomyces sp. 'palustris']